MTTADHWMQHHPAGLYDPGLDSSYGSIAGAPRVLLNRGVVMPPGIRPAGLYDPEFDSHTFHGSIAGTLGVLLPLGEVLPLRHSHRSFRLGNYMLSILETRVRGPILAPT